ncbi:MAG TPA: helix-turn-helix domain-containing protein [Candidatus Dormibacteraeota bacterium]|nr:helix-turn-helix domain-containing protein [Candidatus Dormibacteraeota bacterium]
MTPAPDQSDLFPEFSPSPQLVFVNDRVSLQTEADQRLILVHGVVYAHYSQEDHLAEAYALIKLYESGYADQNDLARSFGYSTRTLRRLQQRLRSGGLNALVRPQGRPAGTSTGPKPTARDRTILRLKARGLSNRGIGSRLGLGEKMIRKTLRRLGWQPAPEATLPLLPKTDPPTEPATISDSPSDPIPLPAPPPSPPQKEEGGSKPSAQSLDLNPLDRSMDRLFAKMGLLDDALPLFAPAQNLSRAGVLLAIPALVASGLLSAAEKIYGNLHPSFYGLRTTLVASVLLALLRIPRPEMLKEYPPGELGRIVGLDRMPEVKTLRRKLSQLAKRKGSYALGQAIAQRRIRERGRVVGFLYVDGHVRAYHGKRTIPKAYVSRRRLAAPATTDYWVNDRRGDPLLVVTAEANATLTRMLPNLLGEVRKLLGPKRKATVVFDRGGWSPKLFRKLLTLGFDLLTYRKGHTRQIAEARFTEHKATLDGRPVKYLLHDQAVRFLRGKLRLRQITRLSPNGHQTPILTSRWDLPAVQVAYRMFERWRQENFFKYLGEEYLIDALVDYQVEPDDPNRSVPNPARKAVEKELRRRRAHLTKLRESYAAIDTLPRGLLRSARQKAKKKLRTEMDQARDEIEKLRARHRSLPQRVPVAQTQKEEVVKLSTERKHLTNVLKMVAYQMESDVLELIRPHYKRVEEEGRTFIQAALQDAADLEPTQDQLRITLAPLSSPHRSRVLQALCEILNETHTKFPGTEMEMHYAVATAPESPKSGQFSEVVCQEI